MTYYIHHYDRSYLNKQFPIDNSTPSLSIPRVGRRGGGGGGGGGGGAKGRG